MRKRKDNKMTKKTQLALKPDEANRRKESNKPEGKTVHAVEKMTEAKRKKEKNKTMLRT